MLSIGHDHICDDRLDSSAILLRHSYFLLLTLLTGPFPAPCFRRLGLRFCNLISLGNSRVSSAREFSTYFVNGAVMLSAVLQRNAKHEARLSNIPDLISVRIDPEMIRDSSPAPA